MRKPGLLQQVQVLLQRIVIGFRFIKLGDRDDSVFIHEPSQVVNVAVRIVAGDSALQPDGPA